MYRNPRRGKLCAWRQTHRAALCRLVQTDFNERLPSLLIELKDKFHHLQQHWKIHLKHTVQYINISFFNKIITFKSIKCYKAVYCPVENQESSAFLILVYFITLSKWVHSYVLGYRCVFLSIIEFIICRLSHYDVFISCLSPLHIRLHSSEWGQAKSRFQFTTMNNSTHHPAQ